LPWECCFRTNSLVFPPPSIGPYGPPVFTVTTFCPVLTFLPARLLEIVRGTPLLLELSRVPTFRGSAHLLSLLTFRLSSAKRSPPVEVFSHPIQGPRKSLFPPFKFVFLGHTFSPQVYFAAFPLLGRISLLADLQTCPPLFFFLTDTQERFWRTFFFVTFFPSLEGIIPLPQSWPRLWLSLPPLVPEVSPFPGRESPKRGRPPLGSAAAGLPLPPPPRHNFLVFFFF